MHLHELTSTTMEGHLRHPSYADAEWVAVGDMAKSPL